jgi:transposase
MDSRQQRGLELAATRTIRKQGSIWIVPSQAGAGSYKVRMAKFNASCTCPDFEARQQTCKHIYAASYVKTREQNADGSTTVTETVAFTVSKRVTYPQNWSAYNEAQTGEKDRFQALLFDLCCGIREPQAKKTGRPCLPLSDALFSATFKVYSTVSGRRFMSDLRDSHSRGFITKVPHYNSISNYLDNPELTPLLRALIEQSSLPLRSVETDFAVDSSGFSTSRFVRWYDHKYGKERIEHHWVKCHLMCGVKTNVVTAVEIRGNAGDVTMFQPLLATTAKNFSVAEVSGDKAYTSAANMEAVAKLGGLPFFAFKSNATEGKGGMWRQMYHYFKFKSDDFLAHYHRRSNIESTFSMMKRKFGDSLRSKGDTAMVNEVLCKVLCHNLTVLIHAICELGIEATFWAEKPVAQQLTVKS